jgi:hypothetical protein
LAIQSTQGENIMANKAQAFTVLNTFADSRVALIQGMRDAGYTTLEACEPIVIEWACDKVGAEWGLTKAGKVKMVSDHPNYNTAKGVKRDVMLMIAGTTRRKASSAKKEPADPVAELIAKFKKLSVADQRKALKALSV